MTNKVVKLPTIKGYTVDYKLREFRKMEYGKMPIFISFDSPKGEKLFNELDKSNWVND